MYGDVEKNESKIKKIIMDKTIQAASKQTNTIEEMKKYLRILGIENIEIPRTAITVGNKLTEINQELKKSGYDIFTYYNEKYNVITMPIAGEAIINDLIDDLATSVTKMEECEEIIKTIIKRETKFIPFRRAFLKLKSFFGVRESTSYIDSIEEKKIRDKIKEYNNIDNEIWTYNFEEKLVPAIIKEISKYREEDIPELLEIEVKPYLKALKLEHLENDLNKAIKEKYSEQYNGYPTVAEDSNIKNYKIEYQNHPNNKHEKLIDEDEER